MNRYYSFLLVMLVLIAPPRLAASESELRFAVVPKSASNEFFLPVKAGCERAAAELGNIVCLFVGPDETSAYAQDQVIRSLIAQGVDGIAVSPINSDFLAKHSIDEARKANIPVITFNSDFNAATLKRFPDIRHAFIGTDNFQFGWILGEITRQLRPNGGRLCLISGFRYGPGLRKRLTGVRAALAGHRHLLDADTPLTGQNGWEEYHRCPFFSEEDPQKALSQVLHVLQRNQEDPSSVDTLVVVGAWPQQHEAAYREAVAPYRQRLANKNMVLVMGDAMNRQLRLLSEHLAHANLGQNPFRMGYKAIDLLRRLYLGEVVEDLYFTPLRPCLPDRIPVCAP